MPCCSVVGTGLIMSSTQDFNVYVGAETGLFKGVSFNDHQTITKNLNSLQSLDRQQEITCMAWGNDEESEILMGLRSQKVKIYDTEFKGFSGCVETPFGKGPLRGVGKFNDSIITASESGDVKLWKFKASQQIEFHALTAGESLSCMRVSPYNKNIVKNDFLDMPVPVWVSDFAFVPNSEQVVSSSRHGHVRLYDPKSRGRRPVISCIPEADEAWTCISIASRSNQVLVGSGKGRMLLYDFRQQKVVHAYRGFTGSIRQIVCHPTKPLVVSVGLDRFIRLHHLDRQTPLHKAYLKSRLNVVLMRRDFGVLGDQDVDLDEEIVDTEKDTLWNTMEVIKDRTFTETEDILDKEVDATPTKNNGSSRKKRKTVP
ncbi:WD repeat-containing protein 74 [Daphnia magna]|uniref:WD repeat-containing protein 74 n=1 Tax=Daphnia magna TaxID=35525 RepID=A0A164VDQ8_9CRUS|nr:WD repeat-containing protein 74 [Daphnia magna]